MDTRRALLEKYLGDLEAAAAAKLAAAPKLPDGVVRIQAGRAGRTPFFFLHGQYDSAGFYCYRLAESLDSDQPFYALDSYQFGDAPAPPSLEEMAAAHVAAVREVAPHGPYILGGWCAGGLLAFEMARQMAAAGERVEHLFLLDPVYLRYPAWLRLARGAVKRGAWLGLDSRRQLRLYNDARHLYRGLRHRAAYIRSAGYRASNPPDLPRDDYPGFYDWTAMDYGATAPAADRTTLIWSTNRPSLIHGLRVVRFRSAWRRVEQEPGVEVLTVPFNHWTALNDNLDSLARLIGDALRRPTR
ncbi:MAG TPA: alpha/beta fold hydrolase [Candidatus Dormibacteraeota bacterium]|nr:alpha/beta fold hydrolase [Candidatus Dormibacteraeota bacterium]